MRKVFALMLLISLVAMLTGCVEDERYWTLPLEDGFEVWCEDGERMLVRETDWLRYAFVVRGIEALRVEDNFILTRSGGESYAFVETATGAVARTASGEDGFRAACEALGLDADGAWMSLDSRPETATGPLHNLYDDITPRQLAVVTSAFEGYAEGELPTPAQRPVHKQPRRLPRRRGHLRGTVLCRGGRRGRGAPAGGQRLAAAARDRRGRFLYGRQPSRRDLLHGRSGPRHAGCAEH